MAVLLSSLLVLSSDENETREFVFVQETIAMSTCVFSLSSCLHLKGVHLAVDRQCNYTIRQFLQANHKSF